MTCRVCIAMQCIADGHTADGKVDHFNNTIFYHWLWWVTSGSLQSQHWLYSDSDVNPLANHCPLETHCEPTGNPLETHWKPTVKPLATHRLPTHWGWEVAPRATNRWGDGHHHTWSFSSSVGSIWSSWSIWSNRAMWLSGQIIRMRTLRARSALNSISSTLKCQ